MSKQKKEIVLDDGTITNLTDFAREHGIPYMTVYLRYMRYGIRNAELLAAKRLVKPARFSTHYTPMNDSEYEWLKETKPLRKSAEDEWEIAAELIARHPVLADDVRKDFEERARREEMESAGKSW